MLLQFISLMLNPEQNPVSAKKKILDPDPAGHKSPDPTCNLVS